jgi:hypothetical protein
MFPMFEIVPRGTLCNGKNRYYLSYVVLRFSNDCLNSLSWQLGDFPLTLIRGLGTPNVISTNLTTAVDGSFPNFPESNISLIP